MARIRLTFPSQAHFSTRIDISIADINYGGHLSNDAVLRLAHEARIRFLQHDGYSEMDIEGLGIIMTDAAIVYESEAFHGQTLQIDIALTDFGRCGFDIMYAMRDLATARPVATVKTGILFFDYSARKVRSIPAPFLARYTHAE